jgi:hypothetical protein
MSRNTASGSDCTGIGHFGTEQTLFGPFFERFFVILAIVSDFSGLYPVWFFSMSLFFHALKQTID